MLYHELPKKGVSNGLKAFNIAKKEYHRMSLTMFGLTSPKDLSDDILFVKDPSLDQLTKLYAESDVFIFPSLEEGWGLTVIEAMASGCAVVGTNTGCLAELGNNNVNALISEPGDVEDMANNILKICNDEQMRKRISMEGERTADLCSWDMSVNKFLSLISKERKQV